jgi:NAD-dependent DNA ligase
MELDGCGDLGPERGRGDPAVEGAAVLACPSGSTSDVGWVTARNLARHFGDVDKLLDASQEDIQEVDGIGPDRAEAIAGWFDDEQNRTLVAELRELGLRFEVGDEEKPVEGR